MRKKFLGALATLLLGTAASAQEASIASRIFSKDRWALFLATGGQNYLGDFVPGNYNFFGARGDFAFSIKAGAEYELLPVLRLRLGYLGTRLQGDETQDFEKAPDEAWRKSRGFRFSSPLHELSFSAIYDILGFMHGEEGEIFRSYVTPYVGAGIGYAFINPQLSDTTRAAQFARAGGEQAYFRRDLQQAPLKGALIFPVLIGVRWQATPQSSVFVEASRHFSTTDYLDRVANWNSESRNDGYINYAIGYRLNLASRLRRVPL